MQSRRWSRVAVYFVPALGGILGLLAGASCANSGSSAQSSGDDGGAEASDASSGSTCDANLQSDPHNCGYCGQACTNGETCSNGKCMSDCPGQQMKCPNWGCVDTTTDIQNCGACGNICTAPSGGIPVPDAGTADSGTTDSGATDSGSDGAASADASSDAAADASGGPMDDGHRIATAACQMSSCTFTCPQGANIQKCSDGCWDTSISTSNCGFCGVQCSAGQTCQNGVCCGAPSQVCGGTCVDVTQDPNNCGSCGHACSTGVQCSNGACIGYTTSNPTPTAGMLLDACTMTPHQTSQVLQGSTQWLYVPAGNLPFPFTFYGASETQVWIGSEGTFGFGSVPTGSSGPPGSFSFGTGCLPDTSNDFAAIEPFGDTNLTVSQATGVCWATAGTAPNQQFVVTWDQASESQDMGSVLTFSVILTQTTNTIDFVYEKATRGSTGGPYVFGNSATVGLQQGMAGTAQTTINCAGGGGVAYPSVPYAIRFTPQQ